MPQRACVRAGVRCATVSTGILRLRVACEAGALEAGGECGGGGGAIGDLAAAAARRAMTAAAPLVTPAVPAAACTLLYRATSHAVAAAHARAVSGDSAGVLHPGQARDRADCLPRRARFTEDYTWYRSHWATYVQRLHSHSAMKNGK